MKIIKLDNKSYTFGYDCIEEYLTYIFLIKRKNRSYIIDTFCGTEYIKPIMHEIQDKEVFVINTHFHWDHVLGNSAFRDSTIISHYECRKLLDKYWYTELEKNKQYALGNTEKCLPNLTFTEKLIFNEDSVELFYSPGHTKDSISIFDYESEILYVGDNLEKPIIYVESNDIDAYINTLRKYISYHPKKIMAGHTLNLTEKDILDTIKYLQALKMGCKLNFSTEYERKVHNDNIKVIMQADNNIVF